MSNEEKDRYKRLVTFKSTGKVNSKEHITYAQIIIGTDAIPDQLRYAVSTNDEGIFIYMVVLKFREILKQMVI